MSCKGCLCIFLLVSCFLPALAKRVEEAMRKELLIGSGSFEAAHGSVSQLVHGSKLQTNVSATQLRARLNSTPGGNQCDQPTLGEGILRVQGLKVHCEEHLGRVREAFNAPSLEDIWRGSEINLESAQKGTGKSGAKLLFTKDKRYMIKTMTAADSKIMMEVMKHYRKHIVTYASNSLMMRVFGIVEDKQGGMWIVANNWLPVKFNTVYDLKGSTSGRKSHRNAKDKKDVNWLEEKQKSIIPSDDRERIVRSLKLDSLMLAESNLIDYSVIFGRSRYNLPLCGGWVTPSCIAPICDATLGCFDAGYSPASNWKNVKDFYCDGSQPRPKPIGHTCIGTLYKSSKPYSVGMSFECFGIIDLLKFYGTKAALERFFRLGYLKDLSVQPADVYKDRFDKFMEETVFPKSETAGYKRVDITRGSCMAWGTSSSTQPTTWYSTPKVLLAALLIFGLVGSCFACAFFSILKPMSSITQNNSLVAPPMGGFHEQGAKCQGQQYAVQAGSYSGQNYAQSTFDPRQQQPPWPQPTHHC